MGKFQKAKDAAKLARRAARAAKAAHVHNAETVRRLEIQQPLTLDRLVGELNVSEILASFGEKR